MRWVVNATPQLVYPGKNPVPNAQEAGWVPGPVWTGAENFGPTGIRSPDCPARNESLYRLSYPGPPSALQLIHNKFKHTQLREESAYLTSSLLVHVRRGTWCVKNLAVGEDSHQKCVLLWCLHYKAAFYWVTFYRLEQYYAIVKIHHLYVES